MVTENKYYSDQNDGVPRSWHHFSPKGQVVNIFGFTGHMVSGLTAHLLHRKPKSARNNMWINEHGCVPGKLQTQKSDFHVNFSCAILVFDFFLEII